MEAQNILIRLLKEGHISNDEFKSLYSLTTNNQIELYPQYPWTTSPAPIITYKDSDQVISRINTPWNEQSSFKITGNSGFISGSTISVSKSEPAD